MKLSERLRGLYEPDAIEEAADLLDECERALAFYADDKNWHYNSELDPCSANFTGGPASATLSKLRAAQEKADEIE